MMREEPYQASPSLACHASAYTRMPTDRADRRCHSLQLDSLKAQKSEMESKPIFPGCLAE